MSGSFGIVLQVVTAVRMYIVGSIRDYYSKFLIMCNPTILILHKLLKY